MRKLPLPFLLLGLISCQSSLLDSGDSYFRQQSYLQAYNAYMLIDSSDAEVQQRIATTRYFLLEDMVRDFSNSGRPDAGLALLEKITPLAPDNRQHVIEDLGLRCRNHIATRHFDLALEFNDIGDKNSAIRELLVALTWRDDFAPALERLAIITEREQMRNAQGEEKYLDAIAQLEAGSDVRARTAFMHASHLLTDPKLAYKRLNAISENLAEEAMRQAQLYLDSQQTGMAWVAVKNAIHLGIDDPAALAIAERLDAILRSQAHLTTADIKVRAGDYEIAKLSIDKAAAHSVVEHTASLIEIRNRNTDLQQKHRYLQARAYEIDSQLSHASSLYLQIYSDSDEYGYKDTEQRLASITIRLSEAELYYQQALLAAENGDAAGHMQMLRSVLQLAIDYKDALHLFDMAHQVD
jgi:anion-transporting  ArsA/GET3 family ATPase